MKVKLTVDLTKYHPTLKIGEIGNTIDPIGHRAKNSPHIWVSVQFEHYKLDVLKKHLEIIQSKTIEGPVLPVHSTTPPQLGDIVEFNDLKFKVIGLQDKLDKDLWLLRLQSVLDCN